MEIAAEVWFWVGPKATGTARFGREPRRHGACIKGSYPTYPSGTCRSADGPVAVIALGNRKGDAVRRSALASGASEVAGRYSRARATIDSLLQHDVGMPGGQTSYREVCNGATDRLRTLADSASALAG